MIEPKPRLVGVGMYSRAEAARLLDMTPSRVSRWVKSYSYWLTYAVEPERRKQPPVVRVRLPRIGGSLMLTFLDLMELRVVKALVDRGLSLQHVRRAATIASHIFDTPYPFASRRFYTDGLKAFASLSPDRGDKRVVELSERHLQIIAGETFERYLEEIDFDPDSSLARRWWPLGREVPVVLDPRIAFGAPVVEGTATRTEVVCALAHRADRRATADAYQVPLESVGAAVRFEKFLAAA
jgi:uncharacterized protein (DUF433 family)